MDIPAAATFHANAHFHHSKQSLAVTVYITPTDCQLRIAHGHVVASISRTSFPASVGPSSIAFEDLRQTGPSAATVLDFGTVDEKIRFVEAFTNKSFFNDIRQAAERRLHELREQELLNARRRAQEMEDYSATRERRRQAVAERHEALLRDYRLQSSFDRMRDASIERQNISDRAELDFAEWRESQHRSASKSLVDAQRLRMESAVLSSDARNEADIAQLRQRMEDQLEHDRARHRGIMNAEVAASLSSMELAGELRRLETNDAAERIRSQFQEKKRNVVQSIRHTLAAEKAQADRRLETTQRSRTEVLQDMRDSVTKEEQRRKQRELERARAIVEASRIAREAGHSPTVYQRPEMSISPSPAPRREETSPAPVPPSSSQPHPADVPKEKTKTDEPNVVVQPRAAEPQKIATPTSPTPQAKQPTTTPTPAAVTTEPESTASDEWKEMMHEASGRKYWYNAATKKTTWTNPNVDNQSESTEEWKQMKDEKTGRPYWFNPTTRKTSWSDPTTATSDTTADSTNTTPADAASSGWKEMFDEKSQRKYWYDPSTKKTTWIDPHGSHSASNANQWVEKFDDKTQRKYWYNPESKKTTWSDPNAVSTAAAPVATATPSSGDTTSKDDEWLKRLDEKSGRPYWYNPATKKTTWNDPTASSAAVASASSDWKEKFDEKSQRKYWYNVVTKKTTWNEADTKADVKAADAESSSTSAEEWQMKQDPKTGRNYWYNKVTKKTTWNEADTKVASSTSHAAAATTTDWIERKDEKSGRTYYYNKTTKKTTWIKPPEMS